MRSKFSAIVLLFLICGAFVENAFSMNKVVLKQSDTKGSKPLLKQDMFYKVEGEKKTPLTNTIFVIQSDFVVEDDVTIPADCILEFDGGSIANGRLNTNGCYIDAGLYQVFDNVKFNNINNYNGDLEAVDNIYIKVLAANSFINKKTNSVIEAKSVVNRRYTYRIIGKSTSPKIEGQSVIVTLNGQNYTIADITSGGRYRLRYDYSRVIGINNSTGEMVSGEVSSLKEITFYSISPLSYSNKSTVKNKEIHPEWFGAKGDNVNEDSYAFNSALDLAFYSDSKVVIGNGIYRIDDALVIHTHTNLTGVVPMTEHPTKGYFSVNTDVAMLVFDQYNPTGSYNLENIGFIPFSDKYKYNFVGIKVFHSQNYSIITNIAILNPAKGIEVDAIGGVQTLKCDNISVWCHEDRKTVAITAQCRLNGWFNANYFRITRTAHCGGIEFKGGSNNILDGGACETNTGVYYLVSLDDGASLIVKGGLYNEDGHFAKLRNSSCLIIEGDSYITGSLDCDESSYVSYPSRNIQTRTGIINSSVVVNDAVKAHYKVFSKKPTLWFETITRKIIQPLSLGDNYIPIEYNGRLFTKGYCKLPMGDIDISDKTIAIRVISPTAYASTNSTYPFHLNDEPSVPSRYPQIHYAQSRSSSLENISVLYSPKEISQGSIEKGERFIFIPYGQEGYVINSITTEGNPSFLISDIYVIDRSIQEINKGNEKVRLIDVLNNLDSFVNEEGILSGYNKGTSNNRPSDLTREDEGFEYFDTTLHKLIFWSGDNSIGDNGWVDALGNHPSR